MRYRYVRDPLFVFCLLLYLLNRWVLKPLLPYGFFQGYLNDCICIPFWIPLMLFGMRRLGLRRHDRPPTSYEIVVPLLVWSFVFELVVPRLGVFRGLAFSDHLDILCYASGALAACVFWRAYYRRGDAHESPDREAATEKPRGRSASTGNRGCQSGAGASARMISAFLTMKPAVRL